MIGIPDETSKVLHVQDVEMFLKLLDEGQAGE